MLRQKKISKKIPAGEAVGKGSVSSGLVQKGPKAEIETILILITKLRRAVTSRNVSKINEITGKLTTLLKIFVEKRPTATKKFVGAKGAKGSKGIVGGSMSPKGTIDSLTKLQKAIATGNIRLILSIIQELVLRLKALVAKLPPSAKNHIITVIEKLTKLPALLMSGNKVGVSLIITEIEITLSKVVGGKGAKGGKDVPKSSNVIITGRAGKGAKGNGKLKNLTPQEIIEIETILTKIVGPKLAKTLTKLVLTLINHLLGHLPLHSIHKIVVELLVKIFNSHGILAKLLAKSNAAGVGAKDANGKLKNLTPADQARLITIFS